MLSHLAVPITAPLINCGNRAAVTVSRKNFSDAKTHRFGPARNRGDRMSDFLLSAN
jgi:hypothetical protein